MDGVRCKLADESRSRSESRTRRELADHGVQIPPESSIRLAERGRPSGTSDSYFNSDAPVMVAMEAVTHAYTFGIRFRYYKAGDPSSVEKNPFSPRSLKDGAPVDSVLSHIETVSGLGDRIEAISILRRVRSRVKDALGFVNRSYWKKISAPSLQIMFSGALVGLMFTVGTPVEVLRPNPVPSRISEVHCLAPICAVGRSCSFTLPLCANLTPVGFL